MDFSDIGLQINITYLVALVGIGEYIKAWDKKGKLKPYHKVIFLIECLLFGIFLSIKDGMFENLIVGIAQSLLSCVVYLGIGTLSYNFVIKYIKKYEQKKLGNEDIKEDN